MFFAKDVKDNTLPEFVSKFPNLSLLVPEWNISELFLILFNPVILLPFMNLPGYPLDVNTTFNAIS